MEMLFWGKWPEFLQKLLDNIRTRKYVMEFVIEILTRFRKSFFFPIKI